MNAVTALAGYLRGEVDNYALDGALLGYRGADQTIQRIALQLWFHYDDLKRHRVSLSKREWQLFRRCIAFLQTNLELPKGSDRGEADPTIWPFQRRIDLFAARPNLSSLALPRYDAALHAIPVRSKFVVIAYWSLWLGLLLAFALNGVMVLWAKLSG